MSRKMGQNEIYLVGDYSREPMLNSRELIEEVDNNTREYLRGMCLVVS